MPFMIRFAYEKYNNDLLKEEQLMESNKTILIIDDETGVCYGISAALQNWGYKVLTAFNGKDGLAMAKKHLPDIVLLDVTMPQMDGFEVLKRIKEDPKTMQISVIMLTAKGDMDARLKAVNLFVEDYITKPVKLETIKEAIEKVTARK